MPTLTPAQVYDLARSAGLDPSRAIVATAIAIAESGLRTDAVGDESLQNATWGPSVGLWQIRSLKADTGTGRARDVTRLTDPAHNARAMVEISSNGTSWRPWSVYTSGKYKAHIPEVTDVTGLVKGKLTPEPSPLEQLNPFGDWTADLTAVGVKVTVAVAALALFVVGLNRTVTPGGRA